MGASFVREFNLNDRTLWLRFLSPLMADRDFTLEGHDFTPRKTRIKIFEGPRLEPHELALGRGWQNVERSGGDVTEAVLARARAHAAAAAAAAPGAAPGATWSAASGAAAGGAPEQAAGGAPPAPGPPAPAPAVTDTLRERVIGRLSAGPVTVAEIAEMAAGLMPGSTEEECLAASEKVAWALLYRGVATLAPSK